MLVIYVTLPLHIPVTSTEFLFPMHHTPSHLPRPAIYIYPYARFPSYHKSHSLNLRMATDGVHSLFVTNSVLNCLKLLINIWNIFFFQKLLYPGFCQITLDKRTTSVELVDECGNIWECMLIYCRHPYAHFKVGGAFKRMVEARRILEGCHIMVGTLEVRPNEKLFFCLRIIS